MRRACRRLALAGLLLLVAGPAQAEGEWQPAATGQRVLLIVQASPVWPVAAERRGRQVELLLRHFSRDLTTIDDQDYSPGEVADFDRVLVVANAADQSLPASLVDDLAHAERPILWLGYGLSQLPIDFESRFGFAPGYWTDHHLPHAVEYRGSRYSAHPLEYSQVRLATDQAQVLAMYVADEVATPYVVHGANLWYVNGLPSIDSAYPDPDADAPLLVFADVLHDFFGTPAGQWRRALLRLDGRAARSAPARLVEAVDYLKSQRVPFVVAVTPLERTPDGSPAGLADRPESVKALRYAQDHGGAVAVRGSRERTDSLVTFEFWEAERNAPLAGESWELYAAQVEDAIRALRDLGLEPRVWETPGGLASPLAYQVFSHYFTHALDSRPAAAWLPYASAAAADAGGQTLVPQAIGPRTALDSASSATQLERARLLQIVRDSWAVASFDPATTPLAELDALVTGLPNQGYTLADLRAASPQVRSGYAPGLDRRLRTWLSIDVRHAQAALDQQLGGRFTWWPSLRGLPWSAVLMLIATGVFLLRLREQWRPAPAEARSLVESALGTGPARRRRRARRLVVVPLLGLVLASTAWACGQVQSVVQRNISLGWSSLAWSVVFDGYGSVDLQDGALMLAPQSVARPEETRSALVLAGEAGWRDYSFMVQMSTQEQLRQNGPPNPWESGWLFFRYQSPEHSYYFAHKTNGLELGKLTPTGQVFLVTTSSPGAEIGRWHDYRVDLDGPRIQVYVDDQLHIDYTDPDPIVGGRVGLYAEDSRVGFRQPAVVALRSAEPTPAGTPTPPGSANARADSGSSALPARPVPTPTASAPAAPSPGPRLRVLLDQDFAYAHQGWPDDAQSTAGFADGQYRLSARQPSHFVAVGAPVVSPPRDVRVTGVFHKVGGPPGGGYGLIVRDQGPPPRDGLNQDGQYLVLEVGDRGEFGVWWRNGDEWVDLVPWTPSAVVRPGGASNELSASVVGDRLTFVVNGIRVASQVYPETPADGGVGVFVGGDFNDVALERFTVTEEAEPGE